MTVVNQVVNSILGAYNAMVPKEGPKVIPITAQLGVNTSVLMDFSQLQQQGKISFIQGVMVDNSANTAALTIQSQTMNQKIVIPPNSQAILPVFVTNPPIFLISSIGGVNVPLFFFNIPLPAQVWGGNSAFTFAGGSLVVSDPLLEQLITNINGTNGLNVNIVSGGFGGPYVPVQILTAITAGAAIVNGTVSGLANHMYATSFDLSVTGNATLAAAAEIALTLEWQSTSAILWTGNAYVPAAIPASSTIGNVIVHCDFTVPVKSPALADGLKIIIGGIALVTGHFNVNAIGFQAP